jgi:hypothetical protein
MRPSVHSCSFTQDEHAPKCGFWRALNRLNFSRFSCNRVSGHYAIITTVSCFTGHYDAKQDPSIAESMLRVPKAGAIAIVAPCRTGKPHFLNPEKDFPLMVREGKMDGTTTTMTLFWENGIRDNLTTGEALMKTKAALAEKAKRSAQFHMYLCELNLLGDPTIKVHQQKP